MLYLEERDELDRIDETPRIERLRQIPLETIKIISLFAATAPKG